MTRQVLVVAAVLLLPATVRAEQSERERQAAAAFEQGTRLFDAEDYVAAAERFEEANRLLPSASVHYNIARSYELAEMNALAAQHYRAFLDARAGNPRRRRTVESRLERLAEGLGWVVVNTTPQGGTVSVDGRVRGEAPVNAAMTAGEHEVTAVLGEARGSRTLTVEPGETSITIALEEPGGEVDEPPVEDDPETFEGPEPDREGIGRLHHGFFWGSLSATVASGVVLAIVGVRMLSLEEEYKGLASTDERLPELQAQGRTMEQATTAMWVLTGVFAAATVVLGIFTDWSTLRRGGDDDEEASRLRWSIALGQGASFQLNF